MKLNSRLATHLLLTLSISLVVLYLGEGSGLAKTGNVNDTAAIDPSITKHHIIMLDENGGPLDPTGNVDCQPSTDQSEPAYCNGDYSYFWPYASLKQDHYKQHIKKVIDSAIAHFGTPEKETKKKLMIFVHGGLNTQYGAIERAAEKRLILKGDKISLGEFIKKSTEYYPIFINWQSSLRASYMDHLLNVRQGEKWPWGKF